MCELGTLSGAEPLTGIVQEGSVIRRQPMQAARNRADSKSDIDFDWTLAGRLPATIAARDYWLGKRCGDGIPSRADLRPSDMRKFLPKVGLVESRSERPEMRRYFIRQAGTQWEEVFGPMTGKFIDAFLPAGIESRWQVVFDTIWEAMAPCVVSSAILFKEKSWLNAEMFIAPLGESRTGISMLFICFSTERVSSNVDAAVRTLGSL